MSNATLSNMQRLTELIQQKRPLVVVSHPRSGTHLTIDFLRQNFRGCGGWKWPLEPHNMVYCSLDSLAVPEPGLSIEYAIKTMQRADCPVIKTHSNGPEFDDVNFFGSKVKQLPETLAESLRQHARFVYVIRDCRNVMPSFHHWMRGFNQDAQRAELFEFIQQELRGMTRIGQWVDHVRRWQAVPGITIVRFEDLIKKTPQIAESLQSELGMKLVGEPGLPGKTNRFRNLIERILARRPASTAILGQNTDELGKWEESVDADQTRIVLAEAQEVMQAHGYEIK